MFFNNKNNSISGDTKMIVPIALYLNLENTLIPRTAFPKLMDNGRESYFSAIKLIDPRIYLVAPAKDWVMIMIFNPKLIDFINNKGISILPTLFSHTLPDLFTETIDIQYSLSSSILRKLFEKILWNGIIPENALSSTIVSSAVKYWDSVILSTGHNNYRGLRVGFYELNGIGNLTLSLQVIANSQARLRYMQMYREEATIKDVIKYMKTDDLTSSCLFDFERPWSNIIYYPHSGKSLARLDIWRKFHKYLLQEDLSSWTLNKPKDKQSIYLDDADLSLWKNKESQWLIDIQRETTLMCIGRGDYFEIASLVASSCMPPRVLTRFMQNDSFPSTYDGKSGIVDLVGDVSKVKEVLFLCKNIQQKRRIDYGAEFLPRGEKLYLKLLHKAIVWIEKNII